MPEVTITLSEQESAWIEQAQALRLIRSPSDALRRGFYLWLETWQAGASALEPEPELADPRPVTSREPDHGNHADGNPGLLLEAPLYARAWALSRFDARLKVQEAFQTAKDGQGKVHRARLEQYEPMILDCLPE